MDDKGLPIIEVSNLSIGYENFSVQRNLSFKINNGDIFIIMGGSGCGKSTLLKTFLGLIPPLKGRVSFYGKPFCGGNDKDRDAILRRFGVLYQGGALWSSLTIEENVALPMQLYTKLSPKEIHSEVRLKMSLVGLEGYEEFYPSEISGGMRKRAGLARAIALDPDIIFFDEPSAGLDPISAQMLDELILELRDVLGATIVVVTHELASIFAVGNNSVFLDVESKTMIATGNPTDLLNNSKDPRVIKFLTRGQREEAST
jgi:phospholipid/cholesterol/gamma-HCH transport system ATP-binding protein